MNVLCSWNIVKHCCAYMLMHLCFCIAWFWPKIKMNSSCSFKMCLGRFSFSDIHILFFYDRIPCFSPQVFVESFLKYFRCNPNHSFQFLVRQSTSTNFSGIFSAFYVHCFYLSVSIILFLDSPNYFIMSSK
jgi:hypothetical protein